jgi:Spy/CpxP family protein refolding chaperone
MRYSLMKYASIATFAAGIVFAQTPTGASRPGAGYPEEGRNGFMWGHMNLDHVAQALNLTDSQKGQARMIFERARQVAQPIRQELKANREKLMAAAKVSNSEAEIQKLANDQGGLLGKLIAIRTEADAKFYQLLTPEQRVKADQMREQFKQRVRSQKPRTEDEQ